MWFNRRVRFVVLWFIFSNLFFSGSVFSGTPHKSRQHCWQSLSRHKDNICCFYRTSMAQGKPLLWGNLLLPVNTFLQIWDEADQHSYIYAVFKPSNHQASVNNVFFDIGLAGIDPHRALFQPTQISDRAMRLYSHYDFIFHPATESLPASTEEYGSPVTSGGRPIQEESDTFNCGLDSSGHSTQLTIHCWYQEQGSDRPFIMYIPPADQVRARSTSSYLIL